MTSVRKCPGPQCEIKDPLTGQVVDHRAHPFTLFVHPSNKVWCTICINASRVSTTHRPTSGVNASSPARTPNSRTSPASRPQPGQVQSNWTAPSAIGSPQQAPTVVTHSPQVTMSHLSSHLRPVSPILRGRQGQRSASVLSLSEVRSVTGSPSMYPLGRSLSAGPSAPAGLVPSERRSPSVVSLGSFEGRSPFMGSQVSSQAASRSHTRDPSQLRSASSSESLSSVYSLSSESRQTVSDAVLASLRRLTTTSVARPY